MFRRLPTDRYQWSDETGILERRQEGYPLPNSDWHWSGEWKVDFNTKEGTDKWGWMYALDFPRSERRKDIGGKYCAVFFDMFVLFTGNTAAKNIGMIA